MKSFKTFTLGICCLFLTNTAFAQKRSVKEDWVKLFNGKDLKNWDIKITNEDLGVNYKNTYLVDSGILKISYDEYTSFDSKYGHMYYKTPYSYYKIRFEYRFVGQQIPGGAEWNVRNSGIMVHSQSAQSLTKAQDFPASLEIQLLGGLNQGVRTTANLCTPGTIVEMDGKINPEHCINSSSKTYDGDQWVEVEAVVLGDSSITHYVEGIPVFAYQKPHIGEDAIGKGALLASGYIAVQAESHPIHFKSIELLNLEGCKNPKCAKYKSYYIKGIACKRCKKSI